MVIIKETKNKNARIKICNHSGREVNHKEKVLKSFSYCDWLSKAYVLAIDTKNKSKIIVIFFMFFILKNNK